MRSQAGESWNPCDPFSGSVSSQTCRCSKPGLQGPRVFQTTRAPSIPRVRMTPENSPGPAVGLAVDNGKPDFRQLAGLGFHGHKHANVAATNAAKPAQFGKNPPSHCLRGDFAVDKRYRSGLDGRRGAEYSKPITSVDVSSRSERSKKNDYLTPHDNIAPR